MPTAQRQQMGVRAREVVAQEFELVSGVRQLVALFHASGTEQDASYVAGDTVSTTPPGLQARPDAPPPGT